MDELMPCIQPLPFTLMRSMLQMNLGLSRLMTSFRKLNFKCVLLVTSLVISVPLFYDWQLFILSSYADHANAYWTGYFTSRPALKGYVRVLSGYYLVSLLISPNSCCFFCDFDMPFFFWNTTVCSPANNVFIYVPAKPDFLCMPFETVS